MQMLKYMLCTNHAILTKPSPNILFGLTLLSIAIFFMAGPLIAIEPRDLDGNVYATLLNGDNDTLTFRDGLFHSALSAGKAMTRVHIPQWPKAIKFGLRPRRLVSMKGN